MDDLTFEERFEQEVLQAMQDHGISHEEAMLLVGLRLGEVYGDGDLVCLHPLTPEQRQASGLDHDPEQVIADDLARRSESHSPLSPTSGEGDEASAMVSAARRT